MSLSPTLCNLNAMTDEGAGGGEARSWPTADDDGLTRSSYARQAGSQARCKSDSCLGVRFQCVARRDCVTAIRICVCLVWGNNSINPIALSARVCARALLRCDAHNGNFECAVVLQAVQAMQAGSTMARTHTRQVCCLSHLFCDIQLPQSVLEFNTNSPLYLPLSPAL